MISPHALPLAVVLVPFVAALATLALGRFTGRWSALLMVAAALFSFGSSVWLLGASPAADPLVFRYDWIPALGVELRFRADPFGLFFALLISGIGALVGLYSLGYIPSLAPNRLGRYYAALAAFMGSMLGIVLADDLILLFVFWEITSVTSFLLIGFWYEEDFARNGAFTALLVTAIGGLALMAGFVLVGNATGTYTLSALAGDPTLKRTLAESAAFVPALVLILGGAFTKSAQVPFHFWLPGAMVAPTPVSTYLHAATMVKAGVFVIGRMAPIFAASLWWSPILVTFGLATFFFGAYQSFRENDLKALLAYSTVSALGLFTMIYGLRAPDQDALQILSHAAYKGSLFLVAGIVEHAAHTRDLRELGGLRSKLPVTFLICLAGALSMAGLPPFLGYLAKESLYTELLRNEVIGSAPGLRTIVIGASVLANAFLFAVALKIIAGVFLGEPRKSSGDANHGAHEAHERPGLWLPAAVLGGAALALGLLSGTPFTQDLVSRFSSAAHAHVHVSLLSMAPGPLLLSLLTYAVGFTIYRRASRVEVWQRSFDYLPPTGEVWDRLLKRVNDFAVAYSGPWQSGSLRWYFSAILVFSAILGPLALAHGGLTFQHAAITLKNLTWYAALLSGLMVLSTLAVVRATTRLAAALALTATGFLVSLMYVVYRSPDILLTQILIETVSTVFILLVLYFMPPFRKDGLSPTRMAWNGLVSAMVGVVMAMFVLLCTTPGFKETNNIARDYLERTFTEAGGHNAVNVIIVDFRAMDTQGEITVLMAVGLSVYGLLRARRQRAR